jgi:transposase
MAYSVDLKERALKLKEEGMEKQAIAKVLGVARSSLYRWINQEKRGESLAAKKRKPFYRKLDVNELKAYVEQYPDKTLKELQVKFKCNISAIWYRLKQLKITLKKSHALSRARSREARSVH